MRGWVLGNLKCWKIKVTSLAHIWRLNTSLTWDQRSYNRLCPTNMAFLFKVNRLTNLWWGICFILLRESLRKVIVQTFFTYTFRVIEWNKSYSNNSIWVTSLTLYLMNCSNFVFLSLNFKMMRLFQVLFLNKSSETWFTKVHVFQNLWLESFLICFDNLLASSTLVLVFKIVKLIT